MWKFIKKQQPDPFRNKYYELLQEKWVSQMSTLTAGLTGSMMKFFLVLFVLLTSSFFTAVIYCGFQDESPEELTIGSISRTDISISPIDNNGSQFTKTCDFKSVKTAELGRYLDSLLQSPIDEKVYDSVHYFRPGLLDSLTGIVNYKNK